MKSFSMTAKSVQAVKFADSDLIGLPIRISCGKRSEEGIVEVKFRKSGESHEVSVDELISFIRQA